MLQTGANDGGTVELDAPAALDGVDPEAFDFPGGVDGFGLDLVLIGEIAGACEAEFSTASGGRRLEEASEEGFH